MKGEPLHGEFVVQDQEFRPKDDCHQTETEESAPVLHP